ncbi:hypothetical protein Tco_0407721 [Tanacetum coccineum]
MDKSPDGLRSTDTSYPPVGYDVCNLSTQNKLLIRASKTTVICATGEWFKKDYIGSVTTWEDLLEKFIQRFYQISDDNEEIEAEKDDDPDDITDIFKIEGNLYNDHLLLKKISQGIGTYEEYELNNPITMDLGELWLDNGVPYQLFDHICEPYHFKNGITKWPTCSSDIDGFCNGGELPGIVRVGNMTYFQDYKWYDELANGKLEDENLNVT